MVKEKKEKDKLTISFSTADTKIPMNQLLNFWEDRGFKASPKAVQTLIEMNHMLKSTQFNMVSNTYHYIYDSLSSVYDDYSEELYLAVDEVLSKVITIDPTLMMDEVQQRIIQGRQLKQQRLNDRPIASTQVALDKAEVSIPVATPETKAAPVETPPVSAPAASAVPEPAIDTAQLMSLKREQEAQAQLEEERRRNQELMAMMEQMQRSNQMAMNYQAMSFPAAPVQPMEMPQGYQHATFFNQQYTPEPVEPEVEEINEQTRNEFSGLLSTSAY